MCELFLYLLHVQVSIRQHFATHAPSRTSEWGATFRSRLHAGEFKTVLVQCGTGTMYRRRSLTLPMLGFDFAAVVCRLVRPTVTMSRGLSLTRLTTTTQSYRRFGSGTNCAITSWTPRQVTVSMVLRSTHVNIQYTCALICACRPRGLTQTPL